MTTLWAAIAAAAGLLLWRQAWQSWRQAHASRTWPSTQGIIEEAWITISRSSRGPESPFEDKFFYPHLRYRYQVGGQTYQGERIAAGSPTGLSSRAEAEAVLAPYPVGRRVTVYYNPRNPAEAVLEPGRAESLGMLLLGGLLFLALAAWLAWGQG